MRKISVLEFMTLDGVMQGPGGPTEDTENSFHFGGWQAPYDDKLVGRVAQHELDQSVEYLLGGKTFDIWVGYWPQYVAEWPGINDHMKYVLSTTRQQTDWQNTTFITDIAAIQQLKASDGPDLQVWGSSKLVQLLLEHDLIDELRLITYPLILGEGKKVFADGAAPAAFTLTDSKISESSTIIAWYKRAGDVTTGSF